MKSLSLLSLLITLPFSLSAEPLIKLESETGEDLSRVELLNLNKEKTNALLRRADGEEFDTLRVAIADTSAETLIVLLGPPQKRLSQLETILAAPSRSPSSTPIKETPSAQLVRVKTTSKAAEKAPLKAASLK